MATFQDAKTVTGAAAGKTIAFAEIKNVTLTNAQLTQVANFISTIGAWPGRPQDLWLISLNRIEGNPSQVVLYMNGFVVHPDAATAVNAVADPNNPSTSIMGST